MSLALPCNTMVWWPVYPRMMIRDNEDQPLSTHCGPCHLTLISTLTNTRLDPLLSKYHISVNIVWVEETVEDGGAAAVGQQEGSKWSVCCPGLSLLAMQSSAHDSPASLESVRKIGQRCTQTEWTEMKHVHLYIPPYSRNKETVYLKVECHIASGSSRLGYHYEAQLLVTNSSENNSIHFVGLKYFLSAY